MISQNGVKFVMTTCDEPDNAHYVIKRAPVRGPVEVSPMTSERARQDIERIKNGFIWPSVD